MVLCTIYRNTHRPVALIFVGFLALTDLFNCAFTIPSTIYMEWSQRKINTDFICKGKSQYANELMYKLSDKPVKYCPLAHLLVGPRLLVGRSVRNQFFFHRRISLLPPPTHFTTASITKDALMFLMELVSFHMSIFTLVSL